MAEDKTKAHAFPTKSFFVRMITRDISLEDCILDLIDNSVDGAWRSEGSRPMGLALDADLSKYRISITANNDSFCIEDNCGGMSLDDAVDHAFSFGRKTEEQHDNYSIGVYGIGMKRAAFKLGAQIKIRSTYLLMDGKQEAFAVPIDVDEWLKNDAPPWDFDIVSDEPLSANGVKIEVLRLTPGTTTSFASPAFLQSLRRTIARDYSLHIDRGLQVVLNGEIVSGWEIKLLESADFVPMRYEYKDEADGNDVTVEIIGGMAAPPPESSDPDIEDDGERRYGWYIICNGRIVLAADRTSVSGWGTDQWPHWHRQYSGFIGLALFTAANAAALPLTTTKRSVDTSSEVYRRAKPRMRDVTRKWIDYTNVRKQDLDAAKAMESSAKAVSLQAVKIHETVTLPSIALKPTERMATVSYSVPLKRLKSLASEFGSITMSYREVGIQSFKYAYDDLVGED